MLETAIEGTLLTIGEMVATEVFRRLGYTNIPNIHDTAVGWNAQENFDKAWEVLKTVVVHPLAEEVMFRNTLSKIAGIKTPGSNEKKWEVGIPVAVLFALAHNQQYDPETRKYSFQSLKESIPIPHFIQGIFCWYLMREKGLDHAILAHSLHNTEIIGVYELLNQIYPKVPVRHDV